MVDEIEVIEENTQTEDKDLCFDIRNRINTSHLEKGYKGKYLWSQTVQGVILGSYFYGYSATQFLGLFADKFGAKWMVGMGVFMPSIFNLLIPVLADIHYGLIIVMRILIGVFQGVVYSSLFSLISKWFPNTEQNLALTAVMAASNLGGVLSMPMTGYLCEMELFGGWPLVFYFTSFLHLIWFYFWYEYVYNSPEDDQYISDKELEYILLNNKKQNSIRNLTIPWKAIFMSRPVWASIVTKMSLSFGYYLLCSKMPTYLDTVFGLAIHTNSWFNSIMYLLLCCSNLCAGPLSNWIKNKNWISLNRNRKNFQSFGSFSCAICLALIPQFDCDSTAVITLLLLGMFLFGSVIAGEFAVIPEYAPNYSGTVFGLTNTLASTTGFMGPQVIGYLLDNGNGSGVRHQWNTVWYISATIYIIGGIVFELFGTAEPQDWAVIATDLDKSEIITLND